jgi:hypothetical protein
MVVGLLMRADGGQRGEGKALAQLWSNLSKGRMCSLLRLAVRPDRGQGDKTVAHAEIAFEINNRPRRCETRCHVTSCLASSHVLILILDSIFPRTLENHRYR